MVLRRQAEFFTCSPFDEAIDKLFERDRRSAERILSKAEKFEEEYRASTLDADISPGFDFKQIDIVAGQYRLKQVELTYDFRAAILFPTNCIEAYWADLWKKTKQNNRQEVNVAKLRASRTWEDIKGG